MIITMIQNQKTTKELQNIEDNFGEIVNIKYLNETAYNLGKEELEFEIEIKVKEDLGFEIEPCEENGYYVRTCDYEIWFNYDKENHEFDLCTKKDNYQEKLYDEPFKNQRTVKSAKAVVNYIERFM